MPNTRDPIKRRIAYYRRKAARLFRCPLCQATYKPDTQRGTPKCTKHDCRDVSCLLVRQVNTSTKIRLSKNQPTDADLDAQALNWLQSQGLAS